MSTRWNFEKQEQLKGYLDAAHKAAKDYLSVHSEADSSIVYRISDDAAKNYSKNPSIRDTQSIGDYTISFIREILKAPDFPAKKAKKKGNYRGKVPIPKDIICKAEELIKQGKSYAEIRAECHIATGTIARIKKKMLLAYPNQENEKEKVICEPVEIDIPKPQTDFSNILNIVTCLAESGADYFKFTLPINGKEFLVSFSEVTNDD